MHKEKKWEATLRTHVCKLSRETTSKISLTSTFILDLYLSELWENLFLLFKSFNIWYFVMVALVAGALGKDRKPWGQQDSSPAYSTKEGQNHGWYQLPADHFPLWGSLLSGDAWNVFSRPLLVFFSSQIWPLMEATQKNYSAFSGTYKRCPPVLCHA